MIPMLHDQGRTTMDDTQITRRAWILRTAATTLGGAALLALRPAVSAAAPKPTAITVYKDPSCGCCTKWVAHLQANGFAPEVHDRTDMDALKNGLGVPTALRSCHTAVAGKYVIEGHVPAADVKRLLAAKPAWRWALAAIDTTSWPSVRAVRDASSRSTELGRTSRSADPISRDSIR